MTADSPTYWMIVTSPDNFERTRARGFSAQGMKSRHRRKAEKMAAGDRLLWYLTGQQAFAGTATITGPYFEDHEVIWQSKPGEDYPWRVPIEPNVILPAAGAVPAVSLLDRLVFVRKWPAEHWHLAFQGNVHILPAEDFATIESRLRLAAESVA